MHHKCTRLQNRNTTGMKILTHGKGRISEVTVHELIIDHLARVLNLLPGGIYITDAEGLTLFVNNRWQELTGVKDHQVLGHRVVDLLERGVYNTAVNPEVVETGEAVTRVQEIGGHKVVLHGRPVLNDDGEVDLVVTFVRDITVFERLKTEIATQRSLVDSYQRQLARLNPEDAFQRDGIVAVSEESIALLEAINNIGPTDAAVLVLGETGVGKDVISRKIHRSSLRAKNPFYKVDCASIPESLVESELFGYAPGAFSGAQTKGKQGFFQMANTGTLFLDEIGELSLQMQTRLLRAIQDQEITRVGSTTVTPIDVRIIAATNRNLEEEVEKGNFRADLFYRLKVAVLDIHPLRERRDDILPLARVFLQRFNRKYGKDLVFSSRTEKVLLAHSWPGNVRELENMVHSLAVTVTGESIKPGDLPFQGKGEESSTAGADGVSMDYAIGEKSLKEMVRDFEKDIIDRAITICGSVSDAAKTLKVDRTTLFRKTKR